MPYSNTVRAKEMQYRSFQSRTRTEYARFTLVIIEKKNPVKSYNIVDRYVAFATDMPCNSSRDILDAMYD